jgi:hypothetical protein
MATRHWVVCEEFAAGPFATEQAAKNRLEEIRRGQGAEKRTREQTCPLEHEVMASDRKPARPVRHR